MASAVHLRFVGIACCCGFPAKHQSGPPSHSRCVATGPYILASDCYVRGRTACQAVDLWRPRTSSLEASSHEDQPFGGQHKVSCHTCHSSNPISHQHCHWPATCSGLCGVGGYRTGHHLNPIGTVCGSDFLFSISGSHHYRTESHLLTCKILVHF